MSQIEDTGPKPSPNNKPPTEARKPWPMRWVVLAIVIYAVIHALCYLFLQKG
ncbi:MAG: hypothetical protein LBV12_11320 [Puniceicoccales bacterium]|nr:hypothetical protein [Puniceicoccales bacterium]